MRTYGLPVESDSWTQSVPGVGRLRLQNLWAVAPGQSPDAIVVLAHRDDTGGGAGANDDASGTAALVELARSYAGPATTDQQRVRGAHTVVFLSTDGGAYGGLGAARFAERSPFRVVAVINLDAIAGGAAPRLVITGDQPRSPAATLVETASQRLLEQTGQRVRRAGLLRPARRSRVPLHALRAGSVRRPRYLRRSRSRPPATGRRRVRRRPVAPRRGSARPDRNRDAGADRLARPGPRSRPGDDQLRLDRRPGGSRLGDRARPDRPAHPVRRRRGRPVRALPPPPHRPATCGAQPAHANLLLAVRRRRLLPLRTGRRLAHRRAPAAEPRPPRDRQLAGRRPRALRRSSPSPAGSSRGSGSSAGARSRPRRSSAARPWR